MTGVQRLEHAALVHELQTYACISCAGGRPDPSCSLCSGHGVYYSMDLTPCGRADCPIGKRPS